MKRFHGGPGSGTSRKPKAVAHRKRFAAAAKFCARKKKEGSFKGSMGYCIGRAIKADLQLRKAHNRARRKSK